ncbi:ABC transporter [Candidatus Atribacteria bacterium HGW-Atribacteria-1]|nr:MAG: ABC transporter [Candidatus Atribacteria bacterium HGW-Atribacteria-1]
MKKNIKVIIAYILSIILTGLIFIVPFYFAVINSFKSQGEAMLLQVSLPTSYHIIENYKEVIRANNGIIVRAFLNSSILVIFSVIGGVIVSSMAGFVLQRRKHKFVGLWNFIILFGLIVPVALVPTIWLLQILDIYKTFLSMILIEITLTMPFSVLLYKGFMKTIPREIDEAAILDGCGQLRLFFQVIFPLLKPITITVIVLNLLTIYNDFMNPLYFFPGAKNVTVQVTLYNYIGEYYNQWNLLFANVILISIPPLILFIFLNKKIVSGMVAGGVKDI